MRAFGLVVMLVVLAANAGAQPGDQPAIQARIDTFIARTNAADWNAAFQMIYPKLFTYVPRQDLVDMMDEMGRDGLGIRMDNVRIRTLSLPIESGEEAFVRAEYVGDMTVHIDRDGKYGPEAVIDLLEDQFAATYGKENVSWDSQASVFRIRAEKAMIAVRGSADAEWMLVEINPDEPELMAFLFPPEVIRQLVRPD